MTEPPTTHESDTCAAAADRLRACLLPARSVLILTHDFPDPDCIASAFGISHLLSFWDVKSPVVSFGGFVGRAENRAMIRFLDITMVPYVLIDIKDFDHIVLVDSYPGKGNVSLPAGVPVSAVIDHHPQPPENPHDFYTDIRNDIGATSTLIVRYLLGAGCPITSKLATALFYGIKTDTGGMRRDVSHEDLECYKCLFDKIDHRLLSLIENPDRDVEYFRLLHKATEAAISYGDLGYTHLGAVSTPDYVAEMTDLFHSLESIEWMVCSGIFTSQIFFSIRSKKKFTAGVRAEQLARKMGGSGGGHGRVAAGRIPIPSPETANNMMVQFEVILKELFDITGKPPKTLL